MNLIICCTPLQVLIAEKIIDKFPYSEFYGVMLSTVSNKKFDFYSQRLAKKCGPFFTMIQHNDRFNLLKEICYLKCHFGGKKFDQVFVANINDLQIHFLLSAIQFEQLNTFDDGTINIVENSLFYQNEIPTLKRKLVNALLGNKYSIQLLRSLSQRHYTIYHGFKNIIDNVVNIDLVEPCDMQIRDSDCINVLLGQPVFLDEQRNITLAEQVIRQFNIHYYFPHPREKYRLDNVEYIDTELIFEDYIIQQAKKKKYRVFTYFSSAIINIMNKSDNIEVVALRIETENPAYEACYGLFDELGVQLIDIRA
ncbi:glycosyltransferase family 52 protein [Pasteurella canis]|uniref:CMP-N-acetylneuraminate:beta-galactoside alpha-2,3-sialyltransferase n=1 Tax=Pasteurella canis TaxID=753 RepID=UPI001CC7EF9C|nr:glycosyltransferase family 52 [Pasteurella canis]UAY78238.1 glycosyltransferase family 52 protein [Pasteurella canis]